jgi:hypothetical protein
MIQKRRAQLVFEQLSEHLPPLPIFAALRAPSASTSLHSSNPARAISGTEEPANVWINDGNGAPTIIKTLKQELTNVMLAAPP